MRAHVAFLVNNYPPHVGGVERHVASLAQRLIAAGDRVTVVTLGSPVGEVDEGGVRVIRLSGWLSVGAVLSYPRPGATRRIVDLLREQDVTVVSTHTRFFPLSAIGIRVARRLGVPVVHTEHGSDFVRGVNPIVGLASRVIDLTFGRWVLRAARVVLGVSDRVVEFTARLAHVRARVFYNAVDLDVWRGAARPARRRLVFVGRLVPGKGWRELLDAVELLRDRGVDDFEIAIYGDGPEGDDLRHELERRALAEVVEVHGLVESRRLADGVAGAVLVNPTTLAEGFQTSLIEVVAAGGRAVTFDVAGARTLAEDGAPVRVVAPTVAALVDALEAELAHPAPAYRQDRLAAWGWSERVEDYRRVLAEVAEHGMPHT